MGNVRSLTNKTDELAALVKTQREYRERQPATTRTVQQWSDEVEEELRECYRSTDWDMFLRVRGEDINGLSHCITDYIRFCEESIVPTKKYLASYT
ncbi:hypothetical protein JOQ06_013613 [Pogonophryne albipinna]|uniref:Uncharacterized protein n=1 Tax=Pogonophryne albipinna TaxID=1090488 RepID=A0AAD6BLR8_9TELE|nr:hypothetical protein JOQ06_013613 [Pogonophryne albipinna]